MGSPTICTFTTTSFPNLLHSGRRIVALDFLGFGTSDKPPGATYSFKQQVGDLEAVIEFLGLGKVVLVAHDSSGPAAITGPAAINFSAEMKAAAAALTTKVLAIGSWTAKAKPEARLPMMPSEARDTMRLQLAGKSMSGSPSQTARAPFS